MDFIDEVQEELKHERWLNFWKHFGGYFVIASVAVIVATVGIVSWQRYAHYRAVTEGTDYFKAAELAQDKEYAAAAETFAVLAKEGGSGYADLAALREADALRRDGKLAEAGQRYLAIARDVKADEAVRSLATLYAAQSLAKEPAEQVAVVQLLDALIETKNMFSPMAKENKAYLLQAQGDSDGARILLVELMLDESAPATLRQRAKEVQATLPEAPVAPASNPAEAKE